MNSSHHLYKPEQQTKAIASGILSGAFWGTPFLAPLILTQYSSVEIAFARFFIFGIFSLLFLPRLIILVRTFSLIDFIQAILICATGFWLYTIALFTGVKLTNGVVSALIVGTLPLTITLFSKPQFNHKLILGLTFISIGIIVLLMLPFLFTHNFSSLHHIHLSGIVSLLLALAMWTWYAIANSQFILKHPTMKSLDFSSLMGIISMIFMLPIFLYSHSLASITAHSQFPHFIFWGIILGIGASWLANFFWAYCCQNTPPSIYGTLIVSETVFGLLYSFIYQQRLPYSNELIAIILLISGVIITIKSQQKLS